jgi:hypothetical protein
MIHPPRRSVTRFFIPLIDVLTLLFCIFLVMPLAKEEREAAAKDQLKAAAGDRNPALEAENKQLRLQIEELEARKPEWASVRVIEFNTETGERFYYRKEEDETRLRVSLGKTKDPDAATRIERMVEEDRRQVGSNRKLTYTVQFPRKPGYAHPSDTDLEELEKQVMKAGASFGIEGDLKKPPSTKEGGGR